MTNLLRFVPLLNNLAEKCFCRNIRCFRQKFLCFAMFWYFCYVLLKFFNFRNKVKFSWFFLVFSPYNCVLDFLFRKHLFFSYLGKLILLGKNNWKCRNIGNIITKHMIASKFKKNVIKPCIDFFLMSLHKLCKVSKMYVPWICVWYGNEYML